MNDNDKTFEDLVREEAYAIWQVRMKYGIPGEAQRDWVEAEDKIRHRNVEDILSNRIKDYLI